MKEMSFVFNAKTLSGGLWPERTTPKSASTLTGLRNLRCKPFGLEAATRLSEASFARAAQWPLPQWHEGKVFYADHARTEDGEMLDFYDAYDSGEQVAITPGGLWHHADFGEAWMSTNGSSWLFYRPGDGKILSQSATSISSVCAFQGRALMGGFSDYWDSGFGRDLTPDSDFSSGAYWAAGAGWGISNNLASATDPTAPLKMQISGLKAGHRYRVSMTLDEVGQYCVVRLGGEQGAIRHEAGIYAEEMEAGGGEFVEVFAGAGATVVSRVVVEEYQDRKGFWASLLSGAGRKMTPEDTLGAGAIWWSAAGGGNVLSLFNQALALEDSARPLLMDFLQRGDTGFINLPLGRVLRLLPLGGRVIAYCSGGVAALTPMSDPIPGFGSRILARHGIHDRGSAAGDDSGHVFLGAEGVLYRISPDLNVERLGHGSRMAALLDGDVSVQHDVLEKQFYISGEDAGFTLTESGLSEATQRPSSLFVRNGETSALGALEDPSAVWLQSGPFDMGNRAIKIVRSIHVEHTGLGSLRARLHALYAGVWSTKGWILLNTWDTATVQTSGTDFKLEIEGSASADATLTEVSVSWGTTDGRDIRGLYTPEQQ